MVKRYEYVYEVQGKGGFPLDMLRYDRCWFARETDSLMVLGARKASDYVIRVRGLQPPTEARWKSFGWVLATAADKQVAQ